jgi:hypothetical protein
MKKKFTFTLSNGYPYIGDNVWKKSILLHYQIDIELV